MTKVVYALPAKSRKQKRYVVQFRDVENPAQGWVTCIDAFHFKWVAIACVTLAPLEKYDQRIVDTRDWS